MKTLEYYFALPYRVEVVPEECTDGTRCYRAFHPELPGCMSHASTPHEAMANLVEARRLVIEHLLAAGQTVPEPAASTASATSAPVITIWVELGGTSAPNVNLSGLALPTTKTLAPA